MQQLPNLFQCLINTVCAFTTTFIVFYGIISVLKIFCSYLDFENYSKQYKKKTMKASEAKQIAQLGNSEAIKKQMDECYAKIDKAARNGEMITYLYDRLLTQVRTKIQEDGYVVTESDHRNEITTTISWV